ncbi:MAG: SH3 domain-containing protein [Polyangia bacterium]
MKLPSLRTGLIALAFSSLSLFSAVASAETGEARGATMVRDHAAANGKVVDRIASGAKLTILDFSADGGWVHVRTKGGREGWVPVSTVRTKEGSSAAVAAAEAPAAPAEDDTLAKRRNVRGEAWVSKSKYHDEDTKMTVVAAKAELYGRPIAAGTVLGLVRRGEVVQFVRKSSDKKWVQIDIGAGELAWVDARAVRMGADMGNEPPPREDRRDDRRDDPAPTPSKHRTDSPSPAEVRRDDHSRDESRERDERDRRDREDRDRRDREDRDRADRDRRDRDDRDRASRDRDSDRRAHDDDDRDDRDRRDREERRKRRRAEDRAGNKHGPNYIDATVKVGFGKVGEVVRTNGTTTNYIANYKQLTTGLAIGAQLGYTRALTSKLRLHVDFKYTVVALASVVYTASDASTTKLQILDQNIGGGVAVGGFFDAAGGIDLRLRLGIDAWINALSASNPPLAISQDIVLGMAIGVQLAMPAPIMIANRPLGFRLKLGAIAPATRIQQANLITTPHNTTVGGYVGGAIFFGLIDDPHKGQLHIELAYDFSFAFSHFTGDCKATTLTSRQCRDDTVNDANYSSAQHIGTLGLYYQY